MSKALPYTAGSPAASHRSGRRVISDALWLSCPLLAGAGLAAASWGQMSWWPGVAFGGAYLLHLLRAQPRLRVTHAPEPLLELNHFGAVLRGGMVLPAAASNSLSWAEMTRIDAVTIPAEIPSQGISFVLMAEAAVTGVPPRQLVVPGVQAVASELLQAMTTHLGPLDQAQLLRAITRQGDGRFTLWQRSPAQS